MQILISLEDQPEAPGSEFSAHVAINMNIIKHPDAPDDSPARRLATFLEKAIEVYVKNEGSTLENKKPKHMVHPPELQPLEKDLQDLINQHFTKNGAHPQKVALTLAEIIISLLGTLTWQPLNVRAAVKSAEETFRHLGGREKSKEESQHSKDKGMGQCLH